MPDRPVALVTGGTRGIGRAITGRLLDDGWNVVATYRSDTAAAAALGEHERVLVLRADVSDPEDCRGAVTETVRRFGALDHLVGSAAITRDAPVADITDADWDAVLATNLSGAFYAARAALPHVTASGRGRIVTISSIAATMGNAGQAAYAASKAGLLGLTRSLAREVASTGTTVNLVLPGPTAGTGLAEGTDAAFVEAIARKIPMRRLGRPEETAHIVRMLLDDRASFTTGAVVTVDGGLSM